MSVQCFVAGNLVALEGVMRRVMNFGQVIPGWLAASYELRVGRDEFIDLVQAQYRNALQELKDDEPFDDRSIPVVNDLRRLSWPTIENLIEAHPSVLVEYIKFFDIDVIDSLIVSPTRLPSHQTNQINSLDSVVVDEKIVRLVGCAYPPRRTMG